MAHCERCIHYDICDSYYGFDDIGTLICHKDCKDFKDKADVVEVRHGKWKEKGTGEIYCSVCERVQGNANRPYYDTVEEMTLLERYCSGCGAKMDGKGEG